MSERGETQPEDASRAGKKRRMPRGRVVVFENWCKGCGLCIEFCPTQVLKAGEDGHPLVAQPDRCTACHWCDTHCPDFAILVEDLDDDGVGEGGEGA